VDVDVVGVEVVEIGEQVLAEVGGGGWGAGHGREV
jgi:hypothetical protein